MLKYLVILLSDKSVPYCCYSTSADDKKIMPLSDLRKAIRFGMMENLSIQFVFPEEKLPDGYHSLIESVDHTKIMPFSIAGINDVGVVESWKLLNTNSECSHIIIRTSLAQLIAEGSRIIDMFDNYARINIVITDIENASETDAYKYKHWLEEFAETVAIRISDKSDTQINILTDRLFLSKMRNCNAGNESITIAPDGKFYICPAFYYDSDKSVGNLTDGLDIPNKQLYDLRNAPICRICDAWHCHRCVWMNKRKTYEVNTPGRIQCIISHIERNASRLILNKISTKATAFTYSEIPEIDYLDPFDKLT